MLQDDEVEAGKGGWLIKASDIPIKKIPYGKEQPSPDGRYHLCAVDGKLRCFFAPGFGS